MEKIRNFRSSKEDFQVIKPTINMFLLSVSTFIGNSFLWLFLSIWGFSLGSIAFDGSASFGLFTVVFLFFVTLFIGLFLRRASLKKTEYKFYADRVEYYEGFLVKNRKTINYDRISNVGQRKGILEGLFGLGTIFVDTAGYSHQGHELSIHYLDNPDQIYDWITRVVARGK